VKPISGRWKTPEPPSSHCWNEGASSPYIMTFMHDGAICVIR